MPSRTAHRAPRQALRALADKGITVKVVTGDNELVAARVCADVGIDVGEVVTGAVIDGLDDGRLTELVARTTVFAKVNPAQKARIVRALQHDDHTVGFLGDGINDAAALREADVGISVDTAVDIAKESADIILLEKDLTVLEQGIGLQPLPMSYFPWLIGTLLAYCVLTQLVKTWFIRRFDSWL
ncbi:MULTISPECIES: HAD-IC family P-type ATPase [unclassified Streptomyces]|uniref:HAD-IC family P-type ATPase n=1 Tax=unclassified Streptomyces TaxID=2593676 RepID=UPI002DD8752D|nr:HAD-IC family P-type ATPase [Streptomyces sp. NBC_01788]WSB25045.1 HAD-IC family P-type ATPase [Streptomyces sp. NBC_01788]